MHAKDMKSIYTVIYTACCDTIGINKKEEKLLVELDEKDVILKACQFLCPK